VLTQRCYGATGSYLGIDVAIKEVLPSNDYDVAKYFEREWRLMKYVLIPNLLGPWLTVVLCREARHPNVVLYLGLSRAPDPDGRIFIVSEFIDNGAFQHHWLTVGFSCALHRECEKLHS
jgi:LIM domain kinase 1